MRRQKNRLDRVVGQVKRMPNGGGPMAHQARDRMAPAVENAWERVSPSLDEARDRTAAAVIAAMEASEPFRAEAAKRRRAAMLALRGELRAPQRRNRHWMRNLMLAGGAGGLAFAGYRLFRDGNVPWQSAESPAPPAQRSADDSEAGPTSHRAEPVGEDELQAPPPGLS